MGEEAQRTDAEGDCTGQALTYTSQPPAGVYVCVYGDGGEGEGGGEIKINEQQKESG